VGKRDWGGGRGASGDPENVLVKDLSLGKHRAKILRG